MIKTAIRIGMLCIMIVGMVSCNKEDIIVPATEWNYSTFTDSRDGKTYKFIKIGSLNWMAENLAFITAEESWYSWDSETENGKYGRLYTWNAAKQAVPAGWHLPTDDEWKQLELALGMSQSEVDGIDSRGTNQASKLKALTGWGEETDGLDEVGFNALPGGMRTNAGNYFVNGWYGYWWSSTEGDNSRAWVRYMTYFNPKVYRNLSFKEDAYSIRCVKD